MPVRAEEQQKTRKRRPYLVVALVLFPLFLALFLLLLPLARPIGVERNLEIRGAQIAGLSDWQWQRADGTITYAAIVAHNAGPGFHSADFLPGAPPLTTGAVVTINVRTLRIWKLAWAVTWVSR